MSPYLKLYKDFINWFYVKNEEAKTKVKKQMVLVKVKTDIKSFTYVIKLKDDNGNYYTCIFDIYSSLGNGKVVKGKRQLQFSKINEAKSVLSEIKKAKQVVHKGIVIKPIILLSSGYYHIRYVAEHHIKNYYRYKKHPQEVINWLDEYETIGDIICEVD